VTTSLESYPDDVQIDYSSTLKCGACIRGGFVYCVNGKEGDADLATKASFCCQSSSGCTQTTNPAWTCSNIYSNKILAKNLCPFSKTSCGDNANITFSVWNQQQGVKIELAAGETCAYMVTAECGLPAYKPNTTLGFDIETIDYTDEDIGNVRRNRRRRMSTEE
jgi:hypothetical protein